MTMPEASVVPLPDTSHDDSVGDSVKTPVLPISELVPTRPEMLVRKFLFSKGFRYRVHVKTLPGKPDIVLPKYKTVIFVHGCFWHGHEGCKYFVVPKTRTDWWLNKINTNKANDLKATALLKKLLSHSKKETVIH